MKKALLLLAAVVFSFGLKAQCPHSEAIDFTAVDCHGTEVHLFDILDHGQSVLIDFFYTTCGPCNQAAPKVAEAYTRLGCNMHDVFFMEISTSDGDAACQTWCNTYGIEYPTISTAGGGHDICSQYGITAYPTVILITPDHHISINDLWPINNSQTIVDQLAAYGIQEHDCDAPAPDPQVEITVGEVTATTIEATFTPNSDCASLWYLLGTESEMQMWQQMMGATLEQLIQMWGLQTTEETTYTWTEQQPATEYTIYVVPIDADGNAYEAIKENVTTASQGGTGEALVELTVDLISNTEATINAVPNSEVAEYHYGFITVDYYNEIGPEAAADEIREDGFPAYEPESFTWVNLEPSTYYYALGTAKNAADVWGATTLVEVYTDVDGVVESVNSFVVYPNPASDFVTVSGEGLSTVSVFNALGQKVDEFVGEGTQCKIATGNYENGIYFVKVNNGAAVRFVVTH